jgi:ABC-type phosphate transport system substrate-binding protein
MLIFSAVLMAEELDAGIAVIVSPQESLEKLKLTPNSLKLIYLRKQLYWPNGKRIAPVNLDASSALRNQFSQTILGSLPKQQIDYWNGLYFNGVQPPHSVSSDEAVIRFVMENKGAIGYIHLCHVDERVQPLLWLVDDAITTTPPKNKSCKPQ